MSEQSVAGLLPCPLCGAPATLDEERIFMAVFVRCTACECAVGTWAYRDEASRQSAIARAASVWNSRTPGGPQA